MYVEPKELIDFWGGLDMIQWYQQDAELDKQIDQRFRATYEAAKGGELSDWETYPEGRFALILLYDQFSRILFRSDERAFLMDAKARELSLISIEKKDFEHFDQALKQFFILPLVHAEDLECQDMGVKFAKEEELIENIPDFMAHREMIKLFGRMPMRNQLLGRENTKEESEFIQNQGYAALRDKFKAELEK